MSVFSTLNAVNCNGHTEKKNGLTYLSWAWAWAEVKKAYPDAIYTIYENADGLFYHTDGMTAWVKTGVTIEGIEHIEYLPIMDFKNKSIPLGNLTSFDVNKAIQRSLTKACARHGLGLYIYAGEDLPEDETSLASVEPSKVQRGTNTAPKAQKGGKVPSRTSNEASDGIGVVAQKELTRKAMAKGVSLSSLVKSYKHEDVSQLSQEQFKDAMAKLDKYPDKVVGEVVESLEAIAEKLG